MEDKKVLNNYYSRLAKEAAIKASIFGLIFGFATAIIPAVIALMSNYNGIWIALLVAVLVAAGVSPLAYRFLFRPNLKQIAERIDRMGLEERLITMIELENDDSFIARVQREDAKDKLGYVKQKSLKFSISKKLIAALAAVFVCSLAVMIVSAVSVTPKMAWKEIDIKPVPPPIREKDEEFTYCYIEYLATTGGYIEGDPYQVVVFGEDASEVLALAFPAYSFVDWIDNGEKDPRRVEKNVESEVYGYAQFVHKGDGDGQGEDKKPDPDSPPEPGDGDSGDFNPNAIVDGVIDYRDEGVFDSYMQVVLEQLSSGQEIPFELMSLIQAYFDALKQAEQVQD